MHKTSCHAPNHQEKHWSSADLPLPHRLIPKRKSQDSSEKLSKRSRFHQTEMRNQDIPWQTLPAPITRSQLTWQPFPPWYKAPVPRKRGNIQHSSYILCSITPRFQLIVLSPSNYSLWASLKKCTYRIRKQLALIWKKKKKKYQNIRIVDFFSLYLIYCVGISSPLWRSS